MIPAIKSEFRKLFTVRSTYVVLLITLGLLGLFAFYSEGMLAGNLANDSDKLVGEASKAIAVTSMLFMIAGALIMTHEYRYNTIMYTLTASRSRLQILLAKIVVVSVFSLAFALVVSLLAPLLTYLGISAKGLTLAPQHFGDAWSVLWRVVFTGWAYGVVGLLFAALIRNQVGTIVSILFIPSAIEPLLMLALKGKPSTYLPFNVLSTVTQGSPRLTEGWAALLFVAYLIVGWIVAVILFRRRDAN